MSRLMDDLNSLNRIRKVEENIIVRDAEELKEDAPAARDPKGSYFIGILVVLLVAFSALATVISFTALGELAVLRDDMGAARAEIFARLQEAQAFSAAAIDGLDGQKKEFESLSGRVSQRYEQTVQRVEALDGQVKDLSGGLRQAREKADDMAFAHSTLKASVEDSVDGLKASDEALKKTQAWLTGQVRTIIESNPYLYGGY